jgi:hypothetical protein
MQEARPEELFSGALWETPVSHRATMVFKHCFDISHAHVDQVEES